MHTLASFGCLREAGFQPRCLGIGVPGTTLPRPCHASSLILPLHTRRHVLDLNPFVVVPKDAPGDRGRTPRGRKWLPAAAVRPLEVPSSAQSETSGGADIIFRQLFDTVSSTYTYLLADATTKEAILIDPVREHVRLLAAPSLHAQFL